MKNIEHHEDWHGAFTRDQASCAIHPNGRRVRKVNSEFGDTMPNGMTGIVLGSIFEPEVANFCGYFVEWDTAKHTAVFVVEWKLEAENTQ